MRNPIPDFRSHVITAAVSVAFAIVLTFVLLKGSGGIDPRHQGYRIQVLLPSSSQLAVQSRVVMAGVEVGRVTEVTRRGAAAVVSLALDDDEAPVPADSRTAIRLRTLVGEKSLELIPGSSSRMLPNHGILPLSQASSFVEVDDVLSSLRGRTRDRARQALQSLGTAVDGRGEQLNEIVGDGAGTISDGRPWVQVLAQDHEHVSSLVQNLGDIARRVGDRGEAVQTLAQQIRTTFTAVADRDAALRAGLDALPSTLSQVTTTSGVLQAASARTAPVLADTAKAVNDLAPVVRVLGSTATKTRHAVADLGAAAPRLQRTLTSLERLAGPTAVTLPKLRQVLCQLNPAARYLAPYGREFAAVISNLGSAVNAYDANGHISRLYIGVGDASLIGGIPTNVAKAQSTLINAGLLQKVRLLGYNPYPAPGQAHGTTVGRNSNGPQDAENRYTRVQADC